MSFALVAAGSCVGGGQTISEAAAAAGRDALPCQRDIIGGSNSSTTRWFVIIIIIILIIIQFL